MVYSSSLRPRKILGAQLKQSGVIGDLILWPKLVHQNASFCLNHLWKRNCVYHIIYHSSHLFLSVCLICLQYFYSLAVWVLFFYAYILCMYLCMYIYIYLCVQTFSIYKWYQKGSRDSQRAGAFALDSWHPCRTTRSLKLCAKLPFWRPLMNKLLAMRVMGEGCQEQIFFNGNIINIDLFPSPCSLTLPTPSRSWSRTWSTLAAGCNACTGWEMQRMQL